MEEVKFESCTLLPENHRRIGWESAGSIHSSPGYTALGDKYWELLMSQVQIVPRATRTKSCSESSRLENLQILPEGSHKPPTGTPPSNKVQSVFERALSLPLLHNEAIDLALHLTETPEHTQWCFSPRRKEGTPGLSKNSLCSESSFTSGRNQAQESKDSLETIHFRCTSRKEYVRFCTLAAVKSGWLPVQRKAASYVIPCNTGDEESSALISETKAVAFSRGSMVPENLLNKKTPVQTDIKDVNQASSSINSTGLSTWRFPVHNLKSNQESNNDNLGSPKDKVPLTTEGEAKKSEDKKTGFSLLSNSVRSDKSHSKECLEPRRSSVLPNEQPEATEILEQTCSIAYQGDSPPGETKGLPKMKAGFSSITITTRRVEQLPNTSSQQDTSTLTQTEVNDGQPASTATLDGLLVDRNCKPVIRRRKATIIKVTEYRQSYTEGERIRRVKPLEFRHSYAEGENKENVSSHLWQSKDSLSSLPQGLVRSCAHLEVPAESANSVLYLEKFRSISLPKPENDREEEVHRSALSLYLSRTSPKADQAEMGGGQNEERLGPKNGLWCPGLNKNTEASLHWITSPELQEQEPTLPKNSNGVDTAESGSHLCKQSFSGGATESDTCFSYTQKVREDTNLNYKGAFQQSSRTNQPPTFNKPQEHVPYQRSSCPAPDLSLSLRAASVIANLKIQKQLGKIPVCTDATYLKKTQDTLGEAAKGHFEVSNHEKEVNQDPSSCVMPEDTPEFPSPVPEEQKQYVHGPVDVTLTALTLKEALELYRPDFISRSRGRVKQLEQRALQRRALEITDVSPQGPTLGTKKRHCTKPHPLSDNLFKPRERAISEKEMQLRSKRIYNKLPEVKKKKEEEKKKVVSQTNRLRAELFKKKLLDQILQRNGD
ncbi:(E2-independent) E3 ubiquitin-conjugating enzyme FATS isoform X1 [Lepisosteus oculatus]|uniref:(E2-independent) E3 ubiquitin-conjugating enzyme FATS isoform X1 n=1 Tax=Lepisosteus oculatus TaxID=7918 RepID=UPI00371F9579